MNTVRYTLKTLIFFFFSVVNVKLCFCQFYYFIDSSLFFLYCYIHSNLVYLTSCYIFAILLQAVLDVLKEQTIDKSKLGGRELLDLIIRKWGVAYDIQLRKLKPFGDGSENIYINIMWR